MLEGVYGSILKGQTFQHLRKRIDIPNAELGIGYGEDLQNQQMKIQYQKNKTFVVLSKAANIEAQQVTHLNGNISNIDVNGLKKEYWFGDVRGEF